jgi:plastocyanin
MIERPRSGRLRSPVGSHGRLKILAWAAMGLALISAACGGGDSGAATQTPTGVASVTRPSGSPTASEEADTAPAVVSLVARDISFDQTSIEAAAGEVTIDLDNQDQGIPHNIHVFMGDGPGGESVDMTEIASGPTRESLTVQLSAGTYFFHCDVHPNQMKGTLIVH